MGQGTQHQPRGYDALAKKLAGFKRDLDAQRTAANIRNSKITSGSGLTIEDPSGQSIQLFVAADGQSRELFAPPTASQVQDWAAQVAFNADGSYGGGSLFLTSPAAPVSRITNQPAQIAEIDMSSGDGISSAASLYLTTSFIGMRLLDPVFGNPAQIAIGQPGTFSRIEEDGTSWRLFGPSSSIVMPNGTSEVRIRDGGNAAYTVIRASAFTVTSTREAKQDIRDLGWSAADAVAAAKAQRYRYLPQHADPDRIHVGPMVEDLPAELVDNTDPEVPAVDLAALVGVLWAAVGELTERVRILEGANSQP